MDFSCELAFLKHLVLEIRLEGLHHRLQGRIKEIDLVIIDFKLLRLSAVRILRHLVINIRLDSISLVIRHVALLGDLGDMLVVGLACDVTSAYSEQALLLIFSISYAYTT